MLEIIQHLCHNKHRPPHTEEWSIWMELGILPMRICHWEKFAQQQTAPWELAQYMIVVTTFSRCRQEYSKEKDKAIGTKIRKWMKRTNFQKDCHGHQVGKKHVFFARQVYSTAHSPSSRSK